MFQFRCQFDFVSHGLEKGANHDKYLDNVTQAGQ